MYVCGRQAAFLRATLVGSSRWFPLITAQRSEDGPQAPLRRSRWFKCLHMQAGAIGPTMTCEMQLAGMAPSRSLSPGGAMADSQLGVGRGSMPSGSRTGRLSNS